MQERQKNCLLVLDTNYHSGKRQNFRTSGYNSTCADLVVQPMQTGEPNISFGCYGARASSEISDTELYFSMPTALLEDTAQSLLKLAEKSIPEERRKIYIHPVMDKVGAQEQRDGGTPNIFIDGKRCTGCGLCVDFCPATVLEMNETGEEKVAQVVQPELCSICYTCVGQCPERAIKIS